jgi:nucleotide-binding universal stress UspA family protein
MKILLAVDGSSCSDNAVEEVATRPWPQSSEIKVITAFEMPLPATPEGWALPAGYFSELDAAVKQQAQAVVECAVTTLKRRMPKSVAITGNCVPGSPRSVILDEAKNWNPDLIVVGSHGYNAWGRFLLGSVSQSVVSHAKCSVEVVRCAPVNKPETSMVKEEVRQHG